MKTIQIPIESVNKILSHAQDGQALEICGFIATKNGKISEIYPVDNIAKTPAVLFRMDEKQQIDAMRKIREKDETLFGIYHSHPTSDAVPSAIDIKEMTYPDAIYFIVSLNTIGVLELRCFKINSHSVDELLLVVI